MSGNYQDKLELLQILENPNFYKLLLQMYNFINKSFINEDDSLIYKMIQRRHQMAKVESTKLTQILRDRQQRVSVIQPQLKREEQQECYIRIRTSSHKSHDIETFQIDYKALPYIFRFNYAALQRVKMRKGPQVPRVAIDIFDYLRDKLIVRRYSQGGKLPNRMKYEEKVKFLMRAFDHKRGSLMSEDSKRKEKFNRQKQLQFFTRPDVRQNFLKQIADALIRKKAENERRVQQIEDCIQLALSFLPDNPQKATDIFRMRIKRKQLPWTDNMFEDMEDFSKQLYYRFSSENLEAQKAAIAKFQSQRQQKKSVQDIENISALSSENLESNEKYEDDYIDDVEKDDTE